MDTAITFGSDNQLVGIVSRPDLERRVEVGAPGIVFLNAGIDHRVGPRGLYVALSRWFVEAGYPTIRFDYGGLGESRSAARAGQDDTVDAAVSECSAAATRLGQQSGCERFVVCGLCSGAHDAYRMAMQDERVVGMILIDGYAYPTARFRRIYYLQRILSPRRWRNLFRRIAARLGRRAGSLGDAPVMDAVDDLTFSDLPSRDQLAADLRRLVARRVKLCFVYSGGARDEYNYQSQFADAFPDVDFGDCLQEHFMPAADHTISRVSDRRELIDKLLGWIGDAVSPKRAPR